MNMGTPAFDQDMGGGFSLIWIPLFRGFFLEHSGTASNGSEPLGEGGGMIIAPMKIICSYRAYNIAQREFTPTTNVPGEIYSGHNFSGDSCSVDSCSDDDFTLATIPPATIILL